MPGSFLTNLETSGAPVDELDGALGFDGGDGGIDVLGHDVTTIQHAAGHVLAVTRVALHHLHHAKHKASLNENRN